MSNEFVYVSANTAEAYWVMGDMFTYLVTGAESGGSYFTLIANVSPNAGPPPHVNHLEAEQFYVLEGELNFFRWRSNVSSTSRRFLAYSA